MENQSQFQMNALKHELNVLRDRIEYLERLLSLNEPHAQSMDRNIRTRMCAFCDGPHPIWICTYFQYLTVGDRWKTAKELQLCYRCLNDEPKHLGRNCPYSKKCDVNHCRLTHHRLLHDPDRRKIRHRVANCFEPSCIDSGIQNDTQNGEILTNSVCSGPIELGVTPAPSSEENNSEVGETHFLDNLDSFNHADGLSSYGEDPHAGKTTACDGEHDCQQMEELNRLAMLAEREVLFDIIFSGSCRDKSQLLRKEYMTFVAPSGGDVSKSQSEQLSGFDEALSVNNGPVSFDEIESPHTELFGEELSVSTETFDRNLDENLSTEQTDNNYSWLTLRMEKAGMFFNRRNESCSRTISSERQKSSNKNYGDESAYPGDSWRTAAPCDGEADDVDLFAPNSERQPVLPVGNKTTENVDDYSWLTAHMENAVQQLSQKYRTNDSTLLDTLNDQIYKLDEEIALLETPAEKLENKTEMDLSVWLMPIPDSGGP